MKVDGTMLSNIVAIIIPTFALGCIITEVWYNNLIDEWKNAVDAWKIAYEATAEALETERILNGSTED